MSKSEKRSFVDFVKGLEESGFEYYIPDTPVRCYPEGVKCGMPDDVPITSWDQMLMPSDMVGDGEDICYVRARGDSMTGAEISDGDYLMIRELCHIDDGDIVVASVDGDRTVKTIFRDEDGQLLLLPENPKYPVIPLDESQQVVIRGKVIRVLHEVKRASYSECVRRVKEYRKSIGVASEPSVSMSEEQVCNAVQGILPQIKCARHWYAVFRVLVDKGYYMEEDMERFLDDDLASWCPENQYPASARDLRRLAVLSFAKPVKRWTAMDAPVGRGRFAQYLLIAKNFEILLSRTFTKLSRPV